MNKYLLILGATGLVGQQLLQQALQDPAVKQVLRGAGLEPVGGTPEQFTQVMINDIAKWAKVIRSAGIRPD